MNRRDALKTSAAGLAMSLLGAHVAEAAEAKSYRVGLIGTGWYGKSDLCRMIQVSPVEVVALCDVDKHMLAGAAELISQRQKSKKTPKLFSDYREMLKEKNLDLVLIGTPDHWHSLPMIAAVEAGLDVYVQKPISRDVLEGEAMVAAARKHKRVVQVGTQRRSTPHLVDAKKERDRGRAAGQNQVGRNLLLLPHAGQRQSAGRTGARVFRLRNVDRARAAAALRRPAPSPLVADVHGVWQRDRRRHVRPHVRRHALDVGPRLARARVLARGDFR